MANTLDTKRLRQKLLDLAVRGKLVPQDPNDEPASELLARIHNEKLEMVKRGELKPKDVKNDTVIYYASDGLPYEKRADGKGEPVCIAEEVPFELPEGWAWARFGAYLFNRDSERIPVSVANRRSLDKRYDYYGASGVIDKVDRYLFDKPLLLIGEDGANLAVRSTPIAFMARGKYWVNNHAHVLDAESECQLRYVEAYVNSIDVNPYLTGSAQPKLNQDRMNRILLPVPPLAEQRRIVAALDRYLSLVDTVERDGQELDALLGRLRSKVLDLAVRGELTERDPSDEPAVELLSRIHAEKLAMVGRGELKPKDVKGDTVIFTGSDGLRYEKRADGRGEPVCIEDEIPFEIPETWAWARLGMIAAVRGGKRIPKGSKLCDKSTGQVYIRVTDMREGTVSTSALKYVPEQLIPVLKHYRISKDDVYITVAGTIGRCGTIPESLDGSNLTENADKLTFYYPLSKVWLVDAITSSPIQEQIKALTTQVGQPKLAIKRIEGFLLPVPPLAEQKRMVEGVESILSRLP